MLSVSQPVFSVPWLSYRSAAKLNALFCFAAANVAAWPRLESGPMKAHAFMTTFTFFVRMYLVRMSGNTCVSNCWQIGHWRSMYSVSVTGANGQPRVVPVCGMPLFLLAVEDDGQDDDDRHDGDDPAADGECARRGLTSAPAGRPNRRRRLHRSRAPQLLALLPARHRPEG